MALNFQQTDANGGFTAGAFCSGAALNAAKSIKACSNGGTAGTTAVQITLDASAADKAAVWWEITVPSGYDWLAGTWTVPLNVTVASSSTNQKLDAVYICRVNSAGVSQATIGSATGQALALNATGVKSVNVTGSAQTPAAGDKVVCVLVFDNADTMTRTFSFTPNQVISSPFAPSETFTRIPFREKPFTSPLFLPPRECEAPDHWRDVVAIPLRERGGGRINSFGYSSSPGQLTAPAWTVAQPGAAVSMAANTAGSTATTYADIGDVGWMDGLVRVSLEVVFRPASTSATQSVFRKNGTLVMQLTGSADFRFVTWQGGSARFTSTPASQLSAGTWYHAVFTWDGATGRIYLDGKEVSSYAAQDAGIGAGLDNSANNLMLGATESQAEAFSGDIAFVRVWRNRVLSALDVRRLAPDPWAALRARRSWARYGVILAGSPVSAALGSALAWSLSLARPAGPAFESAGLLTRTSAGAYSWAQAIGAGAQPAWESGMRLAPLQAAPWEAQQRLSPSSAPSFEAAGPSVLGRASAGEAGQTTAMATAAPGEWLLALQRAVLAGMEVSAALGRPALGALETLRSSGAALAAGLEWAAALSASAAAAAEALSPGAASGAHQGESLALLGALGAHPWEAAGTAAAVARALVAALEWAAALGVATPAGAEWSASVAAGDVAALESLVARLATAQTPAEWARAVAALRDAPAASAAPLADDLLLDHPLLQQLSHSATP